MADGHSGGRRPRKGPKRPRGDRGGDRGRRGGRDRGESRGAGPGWLVGMHAVGALLDGTPKRVRALHVWSAHAAKLAERASMLGIPVRREEPDNLGVPPHLAQGIAARIAPYSYVSLEDVIAVPDSGQGLLVALDSVTDTRNLGAILRSAGFFSAQGVVIPKDRAATVTPVTERIARGGAAIVPVAQVTNLARSLATIAEAGWTIVGTALDDTSGSLWDEDLSGPICFVLGAEDKGMRRLVRSRCDRVVSLEPLAPVQSLNVASFATLAMSEVRRQQR